MWMLLESIWIGTNIGLEKFKSTHYTWVWCDISCYKTVRKYIGKGKCMCEYNEPLYECYILYVMRVGKYLLYSVNKWIQDLYICTWVGFSVERDGLIIVDIQSVYF